MAAAGEGGGGGGPRDTSIDIFLRVRPVGNPSENFRADPLESAVDITLPKDVAAGYVNNQRELHNFRFNGILGPEAKQDEVFERVARSAVIASLDGINATIFAYGQVRGAGEGEAVLGEGEVWPGGHHFA